ncbi:hypothetical protein V1477_018530 [Vespula maculifrons]|uniref:Uncharacterized protein n=1 Tax=Vespula maculifrons TaxID=7453 RepID=A0ABD2AVL8_VESMC
MCPCPQAGSHSSLAIVGKHVRQKYTPHVSRTHFEDPFTSKQIKRAYNNQEKYEKEKYSTYV